MRILLHVCRRISRYPGQGSNDGLCSRRTLAIPLLTPRTDQDEWRDSDYANQGPGLGQIATLLPSYICCGREKKFWDSVKFQQRKFLLEFGNNHLIPRDQHKLEFVYITDETTPQSGPRILYLLPVFFAGVTLCQRLRYPGFEDVNDR